MTGTCDKEHFLTTLATTGEDEEYFEILRREFKLRCARPVGHKGRCTVLLHGKQVKPR